jgi:Delta3-Delta2-enoyl-CoA isomerase
MSIPTSPPFPNLSITTAQDDPNVVILTMHKAPENRLNTTFAQTIISALRYIETSMLKPDAPGAVVLTSFSQKFWCTGLELDESDTNIYANADGFYPLLATLLDYPYPTIACITGHTFGGACPFALSCDYRVMNSQRGFFSMPPVNLGLHFDGIGSLPRLKLRPQIARKMLLEAYKWTGKQAYEDGIVDAIAKPDEMLNVAVKLAKEQSGRATMGVYGLLRSELWGQALEQLKAISFVHRKRVGTAPKAKI